MNANILSLDVGDGGIEKWELEQVRKCCEGSHLKYSSDLQLLFQ